MPTLGNKEIIINSSSKFKTEINTIDGTDQLTIQGFGSFEENQILSITGQRFISPRNGKLQIVPPYADDLGISSSDRNIPVTVHIRVNTDRHSSEWAIDFIKRGRPFIFELLLDGGDSATVVATKLEEAFTAYEDTFNMSNNGLPFSWARTTDTLVLTLKEPFLSIQSSVDFLPRGLTYGIKATTTTLFAITTFGTNSISDTTITVADTTGLRVNDVITDPAYNEYTIVDVVDGTNLEITPGLVVGTTGTEDLYLRTLSIEPTFDGKYLEENVRKSTPRTSDSYGISPNEKPVITGEYTSVTFRVIDTGGGINKGWKKHKFLGVTRGEIGGDREFTFTTYFLEGTDLFTDGSGNKVWDIVDFLITHANVSNLYLADGTTAATASEFVTA